MLTKNYNSKYKPVFLKWLQSTSKTHFSTYKLFCVCLKSYIVHLLMTCTHTQIRQGVEIASIQRASSLMTPNIKLEHINKAVISCCQWALFSSWSLNWTLRRVTARWELLLAAFPPLHSRSPICKVCLALVPLSQSIRRALTAGISDRSKEQEQEDCLLLLLLCLAESGRRVGGRQADRLQLAAPRLI